VGSKGSAGGIGASCGLPALSVGQLRLRKEAARSPAAPQSTHYPIFILAFGNQSKLEWRIGRKARTDESRPGIRPIPLEPAEVTHEAADSMDLSMPRNSATERP